VFQSRILRKIFGAKKVEETGDCRKLHNEELHDICCLPNITWLRLKWNVAYMRRKGMYTRIWWGNLKEREHLEELGKDC
jgi:hypothetical protein